MPFSNICIVSVPVRFLLNGRFAHVPTGLSTNWPLAPVAAPTGPKGIVALPIKVPLSQGVMPATCIFCGGLLLFHT